MKTKNNPVLAESFQAMGTDVSVEIAGLSGQDADRAKQSFDGLKKIFRENEKIFSRFDPESELSRINRSLDQEVKISGPMKEVLGLCLKFNRIMEGHFDPRVMENLEKIGYDRDFRSNDLNDREKNISALETFPKNLDEELKLDYDRGTVILSRRIDTTGIAKGYTVDLAAKYLKEEGWKNFLVDAGGDMFASGKDENGEAWAVGVEGLENDTVRIKLEDEGIATSGISRKRWMRGGKKVHHLINPKNPDEFSHDLKTVTVISDKTVEADGRAKSLFLMGKDEGLRFADRENISCLFLDYKNNVYVSEKLKKNLV